MSIRPHSFVPDLSMAGELHWGIRRCATCELPKRNRVHDLPDDPEGDRSAAILGEHEPNPEDD